MSHETKAKTMLDEYLSYGGFGPVEREAHVWPGRKFRADFYLPAQAVVVEYDGLMHHGANMGHATITKIMRDAEKANLAQALGFKFFRVNAKTIHDGSAFTFLDSVLVKVAN